MTILTLAQTTPDPTAVPEALTGVWPYLVQAGWAAVGFLLVFAVGWFIVEPLISRTIRRRNADNPTLQEAIRRYLRLVVVLIGLAAAVGTAGYGGILGDSAIIFAAATLALGVAGQTVIGSLVSGMVLVFDPEFNVGNYIEWSEGEGEVQSITLRVTRVHTPNGGLVTIPNETLTSDAVTRPYGRDQRRVVEHVGLAYEDDVDAAIEHLRGAAEDLEEVAAVPEPRAFLDEFGSDAVVVRVHYWIDDPRERNLFAVKSAYARAVKDRLERDGITISPPSKRELLGRIDVDEGDAASA